VLLAHYGPRLLSSQPADAGEKKVLFFKSPLEMPACRLPRRSSPFLRDLLLACRFLTADDGGEHPIPAPEFGFIITAFQQSRIECGPYV